MRYRDTRGLEGTLKNVTVKLEPNGWHISFALDIECEITDKDRALPGQVGIDRSVAITVATSMGELESLPIRLTVSARRIKKAQRKLSKKQIGSKRYRKQRRRVAKLHARAARIHKNWHHNATSVISKNFDTVVL